MRCQASDCGKEFEAPVRKQGGGRHSKWCSHTCRSREWARGNKDKRAESLLRYDSKESSKEHKRARTRSATLRKYGVTEDWYQNQLLRQRQKCAGCGSTIDRDSGRIDHCHVTGKVRGLLCNNCNWALGHTKDDPKILRRLMSYLHKDINTPLVYLGGALKNDRIPDIGNELRSYGFDIMDEWITPGPEADSFLQVYEKKRGRSYSQTLQGRAVENVVLFDKSFIDQSDAFVLVTPAGKSAYMELGYAAGSGIPTFILLDNGDPERMDVMPAMVGKVVHGVKQLAEELASLPYSPKVKEKE